MGAKQTPDIYWKVEGKKKIHHAQRHLGHEKKGGESKGIRENGCS